MKFHLKVRDGFAAAHRIVGSGGRCENMHGHNFRVELEVGGENLDGAGMLLDFTELKAVLRRILQDLDHRDLNEHPSFEGTSPSSERIAEYVFGRAVELLGVAGSTVLSVTVNESDNASATFMGN